EGFGVRGYVGKPESARRDRRWQFFMVNGRPIGARQLSYPLQEAYHGFLMKKKFPVAVLDLQMQRPEVDVNVHPTKEEVRFEEERKVFGLLHRAVSQALADAQLIPTIEMRADKAGEEQSEESPEATKPEALSTGPRLRSMFSNEAAVDFRKNQAKRPSSPRNDNSLFSARDFPYHRPASRTLPRPAPADVQPDEDADAASETLSPTRPEPMRLDASAPPLVLGQVGTRYIATEWNDDLLLIDQHAAHERLVYQNLKERASKNRKPPVQPLMLPIEIEVPLAEREAFEMILPLLAEMGIEIQQGESGKVSVTALPSDCDSIDAQALVRDVLDHTEDIDPDAGGVGALRDTVMTRMACHSAIRSGQRLSREEMEALVSEMVARQLSFTCPHGRPTMVLLRRDQLDHQFGRMG
ncbi:MAG: DNA mismatch repair endonuclease MutL, partial [Candidatus Sumerlaeota bacterium]